MNFVPKFFLTYNEQSLVGQLLLSFTLVFFDPLTTSWTIPKSVPEHDVVTLNILVVPAIMWHMCAGQLVLGGEMSSNA